MAPFKEPTRGIASPATSFDSSQRPGADATRPDRLAFGLQAKVTIGESTPLASGGRSAGSMVRVSPSSWQRTVTQGRPRVERMALTPEQRTAQRKIVGTLNLRSFMWFDPHGQFCIWRDNRASTEWGAGIPELSAHFDTLEIPYSVRIQMMTVSKNNRKAGAALVVQWGDLPALTRWVPSFQKQIEGVRAEVEATIRTSNTPDAD
jgi:hypothetical protein